MHTCELAFFSVPTCELACVQVLACGLSCALRPTYEIVCVVCVREPTSG
jgi:hypothetical protein